MLLHEVSYYCGERVYTLLDSTAVALTSSSYYTVPIHGSTNKGTRAAGGGLMASARRSEAPLVRTRYHTAPGTRHRARYHA